MLTSCSCGFLASNFSEDIISLPSIPTSLQKVEPHHCVSSLLHHLHAFPNFSLTSERWQLLTGIVICLYYHHHIIAIHGSETSFAKQKVSFHVGMEMWTDRGRMWSTSGAGSKLKLPLALSGHLSEAQPAPLPFHYSPALAPSVY